MVRVEASIDHCLSVSCSGETVFGALYAAEGTPRDVLDAVAREFSPRIEVAGPREVIIDLSGLTRLFGDARTIGQELRRTAADRGIRVRVAVAATRAAARLLVHFRAGVTIVESIPDALRPLPISLLDAITNAARGTWNQPPTTNDQPRTAILRRWGIRTLGEFAALPADEVAARLGQEGVEWQRLARGEDPRPLVPAAAEERFEQGLDLEWPIEGLEPLSFVLGRLMEPLEAHLERRDRGAAVLYVRLHLVDRTVHERSLQLPAPMRDARALRTLALLDLESHPPAAGIDRVIVAVDPTPGRVVQFSLLTRALPSPERLSTLMARLGALMGEDRCGSPVAVDTWQPGAFAMKPFAPREPSLHAPRRRGGAENHSVEELRVSASPRCVTALRRFRIPLPARVRVEAGRPVRVTIDRRGYTGGRVETAAGPWRTSGNWWVSEAGKAGEAGTGKAGGVGWDRDEWDVALSDGATYRLFRERDGDAWFVEGIVD